MEDFQLDLVVGQGPTARSIKLPLQPVLPRRRDDARRAAHLGAARPLRRQLPARLLRARPSCERILAPLGRASSTCRSTPTGAAEIARRARGTPRIANRLLRRVRDFAQVRAEGRITEAVARDALALLDVDEAGFDKMDRALLLDDHRQVRRRSGRPRHARRRHRRGARHDRGRLRALPDPGGLPGAHAEGPRGDGAGLRALRAHAAGGAGPAAVAAVARRHVFTRRRTAPSDRIRASRRE